MCSSDLLAIILLLHLILSRTIFGYASRAVAENPSLAQVNGINLQRMIVVVWVLVAVWVLALCRILAHGRARGEQNCSERRHEMRWLS